MSKSFKNPNFYIDSSDIVMDDNGTTLDNFTHLKTFTSLSQIGLTNTEANAYTSAQVSNAMPNNSQLVLGSGINISDVPGDNGNKTLVFQKIQGKQSIISYSQENTNQYGFGYWHKKPDGTAFWDDVVMGNGVGNFFKITAYTADNITLSHPGVVTQTVNIGPATGYRNIAIAGVSVENASSNGTYASWVAIGRCRLTSVGSTQASVRITNYNSTTSAKVKIIVYALQAKYA